MAWPQYDVRSPRRMNWRGDSHTAGVLGPGEGSQHIRKNFVEQFSWTDTHGICPIDCVGTQISTGANLYHDGYSGQRALIFLETADNGGRGAPASTHPCSAVMDDADPTLRADVVHWLIGTNAYPSADPTPENIAAEIVVETDDLKTLLDRFASDWPDARHIVSTIPCGLTPGNAFDDFTVDYNEALLGTGGVVEYGLGLGLVVEPNDVRPYIDSSYIGTDGHLKATGAQVYADRIILATRRVCGFAT